MSRGFDKKIRFFLKIHWKPPFGVLSLQKNFLFIMLLIDIPQGIVLYLLYKWYFYECEALLYTEVILWRVFLLTLKMSIHRGWLA